MKTIIKPASRVLLLIAMSVVYGMFIAPRMVVDDKSFYVCVVVWVFLLVCFALSTIPLMSALLKLNENKE
jgi:hypothetical protein